MNPQVEAKLDALRALADEVGQHLDRLNADHDAAIHKLNEQLTNLFQVKTELSGASQSLREFDRLKAIVEKDTHMHEDLRACLANILTITRALTGEYEA